MDKPIPMLYVRTEGNKTTYQNVDVYNFTTVLVGASLALCWFLDDQKWRVVEVNTLVPCTSKQLFG